MAFVRIRVQRSRGNAMYESDSPHDRRRLAATLRARDAKPTGP